MLRHDLQERFCTAIYAEVRRRGDQVDVVLANGGHLPGVVVRSHYLGDEPVELLDEQTDSSSAPSPSRRSTTGG